MGKLKNVQKQIEELKNRKKLLIQSLGKENFESIVDEISTVITEYNIDKTPTILKDLMDYIADITLL
ncbi:MULTISPECIES: hypothetical protein [Clostridium]|uniref:Uncharacterized protein n=1 Tax=Clostridium carnis TaxID=1530 RepID=A0ABY6SV41_9CLOT|nr:MULTISPECIES: hypothetical protein [Clostridium]CAI3596520.1 conserved hypothetical protein [Clostridium neonatale]CAI3608519.1 conserved hypothetical protein [Clostridium neonatale]CAI3629952.1 conserved hypothetical protein [Clostridium neonatale]CAI3660323.1 conserved hypothetical protein [Clostridium neonatale]CAI3662198.1 conserved hypothetical protein [Clostridium neonatale]